VYLSEIGKLDAKPETKQRNKHALNLKNKNGLDSKWQHAANKQVDDGTGNGTTVRACMKQVDDGNGNCTTERACNKQKSCIACDMARRKQGSDKCNQCQLAVMAAFFST
jgi:hypothetical protein